jgi:hypothetical protein
MNFYITAVDEQLRTDGQEPSIGLILCREHNRVVAEYALRAIENPIGVAEFKLTDRLPAPLARSLPSVEELQRELGGGGDGPVTAVDTAR